MSEKNNARQAAFEAVLAIIKNGAYSNLILDSTFEKFQSLDTRDRSFVTTIVYGCIERLIQIDYNLELYLNQPISKMKPELHAALIIGAYQILFMDRVPDSAAVNESVELVKNNKSKFASSLANAVLRRVSENGLKLPEGEGISETAVKYSMPEWLVNKWTKNYGFENAVALCNASLEAPPVTVKLNTCRAAIDDILLSFDKDGIAYRQIDCFDDAFCLTDTGAVENTSSYLNGLFHVQDLASQICVKAINAQKGDTVFDLCSAPGGKAFSIAESMQNSGKVLAFDIYQSRVDLIKSGAKRLGLDCVKAELSNALIYNEYFGKADKVLCDVPCSGLGVIRRKPEIRFKNPDELKELPELQLNILKNGAKYVKDGGKLIYSTCTLNPKENEEVCNKFLADNSDFEKADFELNLSGKINTYNYLTLMPHIHGTDGFFVAVFKRRS